MRGDIPFTTDFLFDTQYQIAKVLKHSVIDPKVGVQSVFSSYNTAQYRDYVVNSALSGAVEIDDQGRKNIIWGAGKEIGLRCENGAIVGPEDVVKVVRSDSTRSIHAFSQRSIDFRLARCSNCGRDVLY